MKKVFYLSSLLAGCLLLCSSVSNAAIPIISANPQNDTVCSSSNGYFILAASDTATPPASVTYSWLMSSDGGLTWSAVTLGGAFSQTGDSLVVSTARSMNNYWFKGIATDLSGSDTSTAALLLVDTSGHMVLAGSAYVCTGAQVTVSDLASRGTWSAFNDTASITPSGIVTGVFSNADSAGFDTLVYTVSNSCITTPVMDTMYGFKVYPSPAAGGITGASIVCKGFTITLADTVAGGIWSVRHASVDTVNAISGVVHGVNQGFDTVVYTTTTGFCNSSVTHPVRVDTNASAQPITGPIATCVGHTIVLMNANVLGTWTWSAANAHASISSSGVVTGSSHGIDTFMYVFTNACNTATSISVPIAIDTLLSAGVISSPSTVCQGSWIHLSETVPGGIWLSSNSSLGVIDGSGNLTGVAQGALTISYIVDNACGDVVATTPVTVNLPASPITGGIDSVGIDSTITLMDSTMGGTWSISNDSIATVGSASGIVTGVAAGSAIVTYTVINDCGTTTATTTIYVGPPPALPGIVGSDSVCVGTTIALTNTVAGGIWTSSGDSIATVSSSGVVTGVASGTVNITYSINNAFGTSYQVQTILVSQPPVIIVGGPSVISLGGDYFLFGSPYGGKWKASNTTVGTFIINNGYLPDTAIDSIHNIGVTYGSFVVIHSGSDTLTYTDSNACGIRSKTFIITLAADTSSFTPIVTANNALLSVYPNPANGEFTLNLASGSQQDAAVTITNMVGEKVRELTISTNRNYDIKLNEPNGVYLISAVTAEGVKYYSRVTITN